MNHPKAIGFDLFNTLLTVHPDAMEEAHQRQIVSPRDIPPFEFQILFPVI